MFVLYLVLKSRIVENSICSCFKLRTYKICKLQKFLLQKNLRGTFDTKYHIQRAHTYTYNVGYARIIAYAIKTAFLAQI